jgi:oligopeptidase A
LSKSPFIPFELNLDTFLDSLTTILKTNETKVNTLLTIENKTYSNFVKPFEMLDEKLEQLFTPLSHINAVNNSEQSQEVYAASLEPLTLYSTKISQNINIYHAMKTIFENEKSSLNIEQARVIELNIQGFELSGAHLDDEKKKRLEEINLEKSKLTNDFSQNLLDSTNAFEYTIEDEKDIKGMPQSALDIAKVEDKNSTKYVFTLQMPSYIAYMTYGPSQKVREILYKAYTTRAPQNAKIIDTLMKLRQEMAQILGFENFSSYSLATKMAPNTDTVLEFLETLAENSFAQGQEELSVLKTMSSESSLQSYDTTFYSEILKKEKYDIDEEEYKPYFEQNSVVNGLFEFLNKLFTIEFKEVNIELWDKKAKAFDIYHDNTLQARIYTDLEARKSKRGGAWMHNWQAHCKNEDDETELATAFIVCSFPASSDTTPSLLRHDDVVTLFHEMGHAIHHLLSGVNENGVSGVNGVEWDAVEFPSQFLENFAYEPSVLKLFAKHYENGDVISNEMIEKLQASKNFQSAMATLRQVEFALFDFKLHLKLHNEEEVQHLLNDVRKKTALITPPEYNKFQNGFSHIFAGGYAAGYYSYKWAEVLSADAFFKVVDEGIFDSKTAKGYRDIVLEKGGSQSMQELFIELMGREPEVSNLLRLNGIQTSK